MKPPEVEHLLGRFYFFIPCCPDGVVYSDSHLKLCDGGADEKNPDYCNDFCIYWIFHFGYGYNGFYSSGKDGLLYAWAVHPGDVAAVPIPSTMLLLGSGLALLWGARRKFKK